MDKTDVRALCRSLARGSLEVAEELSGVHSDGREPLHIRAKQLRVQLADVVDTTPPQKARTISTLIEYALARALDGYQGDAVAVQAVMPERVLTEHDRRFLRSDLQQGVRELVDRITPHLRAVAREEGPTLRLVIELNEFLDEEADVPPRLRALARRLGDAITSAVLTAGDCADELAVDARAAGTISSPIRFALWTLARATR